MDKHFGFGLGSLLRRWRLALKDPGSGQVATVCVSVVVGPVETSVIVLQPAISVMPHLLRRCIREHLRVRFDESCGCGYGCRANEAHKSASRIDRFKSTYVTGVDVLVTVDVGTWR